MKNSFEAIGRALYYLDKSNIFSGNCSLLSNIFNYEKKDYDFIQKAMAISEAERKRWTTEVKVKKPEVFIYQFGPIDVLENQLLIMTFISRLMFMLLLILVYFLLSLLVSSKKVYGIHFIITILKFLTRGGTILFMMINFFPTIFVLVTMTTSRIWNFEGSPGEWLGFWGGIIGSLLGVVGALLVFNIQLSKEKRQRLEDDKIRAIERDEEKERIRIEKVDNTFFNLLDLHNKLKEKLEVREKYCDEIFVSLKNESDKKKNEIIKNTRVKEFKLYSKKIISQIAKEVSVLNNERPVFEKILISLREYDYETIMNVFVEGAVDSSIIIEAYESINWSVIKTFYTDTNPKEGFDFDDCIDDLLEHEMYLKYIVSNKIKSLIEQDKFLLKFSKDLKDMENTFLFSNEDRVSIVTAAYSSQYFIYGNYFRIFHRVVKYVNENVKDLESKKNYIGFLRAMINEKEMLVIFYNAFYTPRGKGLKKQIKKTNFFGDINDLNVEGDYTQHFDKSLLLWEDEDLKLIKECELIIDNKI